MSTTTGATETPPLQTVGDALERARDWVNRFAEQTVADSYPEDVQEGVAPPAKPEEPTQTETQDTSEPVTETEPAQDGTTEIQEGEADSAETNAEPEGESEPAEAEPEASFEVPPEIQESINKRIGKEVAKTKAEKEARENAEAKIRDLESQLEASRQTVSPRVVSESQPFADVASISELHKKRTEAQAHRDQVMDLLESVEDAPDEVERKLRAANIVPRNDAGDEDYSPRRMRRTLRQIGSNIRTVLERHIPEREAFIKAESESRLQVEQQLPELKDPNSEVSRIFRSVSETIPEIKFNPRWPLFVAGQTLFVQSMQKAKQANGTTKPKPTPPKIPAKPKAAPVVAANKKEAQTEEMRSLALAGDSEARARYFEKLLKD